MPKRIAATYVDYTSEKELFGKLQKLVGRALEGDDAKTWHAVVRKTDNRVSDSASSRTIPLEVIDAEAAPKVKLKFPEARPRRAARLRRCDRARSRAGRFYVAPEPPSVPVRSEAQRAGTRTGVTRRPRARKGLQLPPGVPRSLHSGDSRAGERMPPLPRGRCRPSAAHIQGQVHRSPSSSGRRPRPKRKRIPRPTRSAQGVRRAPGGASRSAPTRSIRCRSSPRVATSSRSSTAPAATSSTGFRATATRVRSSTTSPPRFLRSGCSSGCATRARGVTRRACRILAGADRSRLESFPTPSRRPSTLKWEAKMKAESLAIAALPRRAERAPRDAPWQQGQREASRTDIKGYGNVEGATADKGKQYFDAYGCRGCHATSEDNLPCRLAQPRARRGSFARQRRRQDERRLAHLLGRRPVPLLARHADAQAPPVARRSGERRAVPR